MNQPTDWLLWLAQRQRRTLHLPEYRAAAVLVALTQETDPRVLLTVRSTQMPTHQGQISFPGGGLKAGETPIQAALREAHEEVGLAPESLRVLGELDDVFTPTGFHVTPVLALLHAHATPSLSQEVTAILQPPLSELQAARTPHLQRTDPYGQPFMMYRYPWQGHDIWGMTGRVIEQLLTPEHPQT